MSSLIEQMWIDEPCPGCGKNLEEKLSRLKKHPELTCPACGATLVFEVDQLCRDLEKAEKDFSRTIEIRIGE